MYLSKLIQSIYSDLGQTPKNYGNFTATGGSATTFVNSAWGDMESPPETDAFKGMVAFVVQDAGGAGASPEGKWGKISAYADSTYTGTIPTVTDSIASGDRIMIASQNSFPIDQIIFCVNRALENLGTIELVDTSLTTGASQTEYALPLALKTKKPLAVYYQGTTNDSNNNNWIPVSGWRMEGSTPGTTGTLYLPQLPADRTLRIVYDGIHPVVSSYNSYVSESIHPKVAVAASILEVLSWYNRLDENQGSNDYFLWLEGEYRDKRLPMALMEHPVEKTKRSPRYSVFYDQKGERYNDFNIDLVHL
jgi:hypothetical protein